MIAKAPVIRLALEQLLDRTAHLLGVHSDLRCLDVSAQNVGIEAPGCGGLGPAEVFVPTLLG